MSQSHTSHNPTPAEMYCAYLQCKEPTFYSRIPHIISDLTYDFIDPKTGEISTKKLSVYARELYRVIKSMANDTNVCWMNRDNLAEMCGCSAGSITNAKEELMQKFHQLDGMSLIEITESKKTFTTDKKFGGTVYHKMRINDIWGFNNAFMRLRKTLLEAEAPSCGDGAPTSPSCGDGALPDTPSCGDTNNNNLNKNPLFKEQQPTAAADPVVSPKTEKKLFPSDDEKNEVYNWLLNVKCEPKTARDLSNKFNMKDILSASEYLQTRSKKCKAKGERIDNIWGYFRKILAGRFWEKK